MTHFFLNYYRQYYFLAVLSLLCSCIPGIPVPLPSYDVPVEMQELDLSNADVYVVSPDVDEFVYLVGKSVSEFDNTIRIVNRDEFWVATQLGQSTASLSDLLDSAPHLKAYGLDVDYLILVIGQTESTELQGFWMEGEGIQSTIEAVLIDWSTHKLELGMRGYASGKRDWMLFAFPLVLGSEGGNAERSAARSLGKAIHNAIVQHSGLREAQVVVLSATKPYSAPSEYHLDFVALRSSAEKGDAYSQWRMYRAYGDNPEGFKWLCRAADQNYTEARVRLGYIYRTGTAGIRQSYTRSYLWYRLAGTGAFKGDLEKAMAKVRKKQLSCRKGLACYVALELVQLRSLLGETGTSQAEQLLKVWEPGECERDLLRVSPAR